MSGLFCRFFRLVVPFAALGSLGMAGVVNIYPSVGPSQFSPNLLDYESNAEQAIENGFTTFGVFGTPSYYAQLANANITPVQGLIATSDDGTDGFTSWNGTIGPGSPYNAETGNALFFGLAISSPTPFTLADISFTASLFGDTVGPITLGGSVFSADIVGINTSTHTRYDQSNPGSDSTPINELYTSGFFINFYETDSTALAADFTMLANQSGTASYTVTSLGATQAQDFATAIPEPATWSILGLGFAIIAGLRRRKQAA